MRTKKDSINGRRQNLQELITTYESSLLSYVSRLVGNSSAAEDIVQNTFIKLIRNRKDSMENSTSIAGWLYRVAHNEAMDHVRSETRRKKLHQEHGGDCISDAPAEAELSDREQNATDALAKLSERERQLVILKVYEEKSYKEIAELMGLSTGNVGFILHTAMKKLADIIGNGGAGK